MRCRHTISTSLICAMLLAACGNARIPSPAHPTTGGTVTWSRDGEETTGSANQYCSLLAESADLRANWRVAGGIILTVLSAAAVAGTTAVALADDPDDSNRTRQRRRVAAGVLPTVSVTAGGAATLLFVRSGDASALAAAAARGASSQDALTDCNEARATWSAGRAKAVSDYSEQVEKRMKEDFEKRVKEAAEKITACTQKRAACDAIDATTHADERKACDAEYGSAGCP